MDKTVSPAKPFAEVSVNITVTNGYVQISVPDNAPDRVKINFIEITPIPPAIPNKVFFSYDKNGNLAEDSAFLYSWSDSSKMTSATNKMANINPMIPQSVSYAYDPLGRRILVKYNWNSNTTDNHWKDYIISYDGFLPIQQSYISDDEKTGN
jgi:hypothetical protein